MADKDFIGKEGEDIACAFLVKESFEILDRNFKKRFGEVDIVAQKDKTIHFVEVKTRQNATLNFLPEESITIDKQKRFKRAVSAYLSQEKLWQKDWQIDVITIILGEGKAKINYIPNAFF